jgi:tetratricopeptide (TPR) repeat protein
MMYLLKPNKRMLRLRSLLAIPLFLSLSGYGQSDHYLNACACMAGDKYDSAVYYFEMALKQDPGKADLYFMLGISYFQLNHYPAARDAFYETEKRRKGMGSFYLAKSEIRLNHPQQALKYLRTHLSSPYKKPESEILLDKDISTLDGLPGWQQLWNEKRWFSDADKTYQEALFLKQHGDYLEAINLLNDLEKKGYKRSKIQSEKATIYMELGNLKASRTALKSAVKSDSRNLDAIQSLALIQLAEGDTKEALEGLDRVIRQEPSRFDAYLQRAEARSQDGDLNGALSDTKLYLTYFPDDDSALYRQGLIQYDHGKYLNSIQSFNRSLSLNKGAAAYYYARGLSYAATGTNRYAEKDMSMALDLDPLNGEIWFEKGKLNEKMGNISSACRCYKKAFQYGVFEAGELITSKCK